ncbi:MAG: hypothetical protein J5640_00345 [Bacteroidales bacterium]|nr:hypothetical protein [Bacteroidales bacterium]
MTDSLKAREEVEWLNFWYDDADKESQRRVLFLGDSTLREVRSTAKARLGCPVDFFGSSFALRDVMFWKQLDTFFDSPYARYDIIVIQTGNHSRISADGGKWQPSDHEEYRVMFRKLLQMLHAYSDKFLVLPAFLIVKPPKRLGRVCRLLRLRDVFDENENAIIKRRNVIMHEVADEAGAPFFDLTEVMLRSKFVHKDHIHYENAAKAYITDLILPCIK